MALVYLLRATEIRTLFDWWGASRAWVNSEALGLEPKRGFVQSPLIRHELGLAQRSQIGFHRRVPALRTRVLQALLILSLASPLFAQKDLSGLTNQLAVATEQYRREKFDEALATLDRLDQSSRPTVESLDLRGCIYLEQGKFDAATKAFEAAHAIKYEAFAPKIHLADVLFRQKKFAEARQEYEKLVETRAAMWPDYARFGVLVCHLGEKDEDRARRVLAAIVFPSGSPVYYYGQAAWAFAHGMTLLELAGRFPEAADLDAAWAAGSAALEPNPVVNHSMENRE